MGTVAYLSTPITRLTILKAEREAIYLISSGED